MDEEGRRQVTAWTKEKRPGGRPRRRPHRKYGYSDDTRKIEGAVVFLTLWPIIAVVLIAGAM